MRIALVDYTTGHVVADTAMLANCTLEDAAARLGDAYPDTVEALCLLTALKVTRGFAPFDFHRGQDYPTARGGYSVFRLDVPGCQVPDRIVDGDNIETSRDVQIFGEWLGFVAPAEVHP